MKSRFRFVLVAVALFSLNACGGGGGGGGDRPISAGAVELSVANSPATNGIFDAAPMSDSGNTLWMSYSSVTASSNVPTLGQVHTRIASSTDAGSTWTDIQVDPNNSTSNRDDFQIGSDWYTWRSEVSRLLFDPYDSDTNRRWKLLWHRYVTRYDNLRLFSWGWIGLSTAAAPGGTWSPEQKLFTGTDYDSNLGPPQFPLATVNYPDTSQLGSCTVFTEPGLLARNEGVYVSLQCTGAGKIILLRCDRGATGSTNAFSACSYLGDLLTDSEAAQFSLSGQSLDGFAASELVDAGGNTYLIVTGHESQGDAYRGCLVFRINDLDAATVERSNGNPVLVKRITGTAGSFNGACGYHVGARGSGIIYSEINTSAPHFRLYASHIQLP
jgi:hypothetical protein